MYNIKATVMTGMGGCGKAGKILFLSYCFVGKCQDYGILKRDFPPGRSWFRKFKVRVDLDHVEIDKDYKIGELFLSAKNYKKRSLTKEQKLEP